MALLQEYTTTPSRSRYTRVLQRESNIVAWVSQQVRYSRSKAATTTLLTERPSWRQVGKEEKKKRVVATPSFSSPRAARLYSWEIYQLIITSSSLHHRCGQSAQSFSYRSFMGPVYLPAKSSIYLISMRLVKNIRAIDNKIKSLSILGTLGVGLPAPSSFFWCCPAF